MPSTMTLTKSASLTVFVMTAVMMSPNFLSLAHGDDNAGLSISELTRKDPIDFSKEVLPVLRRNCLACHNVTDAESDLVLETPEKIIAGGIEGASVVPGKADESLLLQIAAHKVEPFMPPEDNEVGARNLTADELGLLKLWINQGAKGEVTTEDPIAWQPLPSTVNPIYAVAVSPHGNYAAAGRANQIFVYQVGTERLVGRLTDPLLIERDLYRRPGVAHLDLVQSLAFSPDGEWLASGGFRTVKLWHRVWDKRNRKLGDIAGKITAIAHTDDGTMSAAGTDVGSITLLNNDSGEIVIRLRDDSAMITQLALARDCQRIAAAYEDHRICVWNIPDAAKVATFQAAAATKSILLTDDSVVAGGQDGVIRIWSLIADIPNADPSKLRLELKGHEGSVDCLAVFSNQQQLVTGGHDGTVRIWKIENGEALKTFNHEGAVLSVAVSHDGKLLASAGQNQLARMWNVADGKQTSEIKGHYRAQLRVDDTRQQVDLSKRHSANAKADLDAAKKRKEDEAKNLKQAQENLKKTEETLKQKKEAAEKAAQEKIAADHELQEARKVLENRQVGRKAAEEAVNSADNDAAKQEAQRAKEAAEKSEQEADKNVKQLEEKSKKAGEVADKAKNEQQTAERNVDASQRAVKRGNEALKRADDALPDAESKRKLAEQTVKEWEEELKSQQDAANTKQQPLVKLAFSPSGNELAVLSHAGDVHTFSVATGTPLEVFDSGSRIAAMSMAYVSDKIMTVSTDGSMRWLSTVPRWELTHSIGSPDSTNDFVHRVTAIDFSPDGKIIATGGGEPSRSGELKLWSVQDGSLVREIEEAHSDTILGLQFSPDGNQLASGGTDRFMKVFDVASGQFVRSFEGHTHHVLGVSWRCDGRQLASCGADNVIKVWDALTGDQKKTISGFSKEITAIHFIGLEDRMVVSVGNNTVTSRKIGGDGGGDYSGATSFMYSVRCSRDGKTVVAGGQDSVLRVWDNDGKSLATFSAPVDPTADKVSAK